jgi:hypothetical protein
MSLLGDRHSRLKAITFPKRASQLIAAQSEEFQVDKLAEFARDSAWQRNFRGVFSKRSLMYKTGKSESAYRSNRCGQVRGQLG